MNSKKQTSISLPRFLIGAPASNTGKTTLVCGLMQALKNRGMNLLACKCGPDYIDPAFHTHVIGAKSRNVDLFFTGAQRARQLIAANGEGLDLAVFEGAMGYYDGIAVSSEDSAWDVARSTGTPCVLVVDGRGRARSISAEILGFMQLEAEHCIKGVILNRVSKMLCDRLAPIILQDTGIPVLGCMPVMTDCSFESRHLGLVGADEMDDLHEKLNKLAAAAEENIDLDALIQLAQSAPALESQLEEEIIPVEGRPKVAIAQDDAFNFYYEDAFDALRKAGLELAFFSPLTDSCLPDGCCGIYLGGGYPELHAKELSQNESMIASIKDAIAQGVPTIAECGGFLYLHEWLEDAEGCEYPLVGAIPAKAWKTPRLGRFGYVHLEAQTDSLLAEKGDVLPAHEFHYWESGSCGEGFHAQKPQSKRAWDCVHTSPRLYAGFPHLALQGQPKAVLRFAQACAQYREEVMC